jgi:4-hydroxy-tetrahydrodipicolinate synthase
VLIPTSTTGEFMSLSDEEFEAVIGTTIDAARGVPVLAGTNHMDTAAGIRRARRAEALGAVGVMAGPPFYFKPSRAEVLDHFRRISEAISIGIVVYDNAFATQLDLDPGLMFDLGQFGNIVGAKYGMLDPARIDEVISAVGDRINLLSMQGEGNEPAARLRGASGFVSVASSFVPELSLRLEALLRARDYEGAAALSRRMRPLLKFFNRDGGGYIATVKAGVRLRGIDAGVPRPPIQPLPADEVDGLAAAMEALGISTSAPG